MGSVIWGRTMNFIALGSWKFVDQADAQRCPVAPAASMQGVVGADVAASGVAQHDATAPEESRVRCDGRGRPDAAFDVEHVVHYLGMVCEEGAG